MSEGGNHRAGSGPPRSAEVIGRWGDDMALLRTGDGETIEAAVPEALRDRIDVGTRVTVAPDGVVDWGTASGAEPDAPSG